MCSNLRELLQRCALIASPLALFALSACESDGLTSAQITQAAEERVAKELGLSAEAALFTETFVGESIDGELAVCGTVEGTRADGTQIQPRLFIAAADPERWVAFAPADLAEMESQPDLVEGGAVWDTYCKDEHDI